MSERICGAGITLGRSASGSGVVAICQRLPSGHVGLDHHDPQQGVSWPVCETYCAASGHICGRYRGDTALALARA